MIAVLSVLILIVILQNTESVQTKILFFTLEMPRVLLLLAVFVGGFIVGLITAGHVLKKPKPQP